MKKHKPLFTLTRTAFLFGTALLTTAFSYAHNETTVYAAGFSQTNTSSYMKAASFEDFDACEDDPQAYSEYEKQQEYQRDSFNAGESTALSGYTHASKFSGYDVLKGIDVSVYQSDITWKKVKNAGIDFAFIRVAYRGYSTGTILPDANYQTNISKAIKAGVDVGVYIYSQAITVEEAIEEAQYTISLIQDYDIHLPIVMDFEYASTSTGLGGRLYKAKLSKADATAICNAFCQTVESMGYTGVVYANRSMLEAQVNASQISNNYNIWLANYTQKTSYKGDYSYWQYTSTGTVKGITGNVDRNYRYIKAPAAPASLKLSDSTYTANSLSWNKVPGVYGYEVYRSDNAGVSYTKIDTVTGAGTTSYTDSGLKPGTTYQYKVRAYYHLSAGDRYGSYSSSVSGTTTVLPENTLISTAVTQNSISLYWMDIAAAAGYQLYKSTDGIEYTLLATLPAGTTTYEDIALDAGTLYYYQLVTGIAAQDGTTEYPQENASAAFLVTTACPELQNVNIKTYTKTSVTLSWDACPQATGYHIALYDALTNSYQELGTTSASTTTYKVTGLTKGTTYKFRIICEITNASGTIIGETGTTISASTKTPAPKRFRAAATTKTKIKLSWKKVAGASGYQIFRYDAATKTYKRIKTITNPDTTTYTNKNLTSATGYSYQIRAYRLVGDTKYFSNTTTAIYAATAPARITTLKATSTKTKVKLSWKKVTGATGYIVYRYNPKTKTYKKLKKVKTTSYTDTGLTKNTSYKYRVVAYKTYKNTAYPGNKATITIKTKSK